MRAVETWQRRPAPGPKPTRPLYFPGQSATSKQPILLPNTSRSVLEAGQMVKVVNACQLDGFLMALQLAGKDGSSSLEEVDHPAIRQLLKDLRHVGDITAVCEARARFLLASEDRIAAHVDRVNNEVVVINLFGNDVDLLSALFGALSEFAYQNVCDSCDSAHMWTSSAPPSLLSME